MEQLLIREIYGVMQQQYPDWLISLQEEKRVREFIEEKAELVGITIGNLLEEDHRPLYLVREICHWEIEDMLGPSRFCYIRELLSEQFEAAYYRLLDEGTLTTETLNLLSVCEPLFDGFACEILSEADKFREYEIIAEVDAYFKARSLEGA